MSKRLLAGVAGLAALGLAVPAMAEDGPEPTTPTETSATTNVSVEILPTAAISALALDIELELGLPGANNWHALESSLTHRNNDWADVTVSIALAGDSPADLPGDLVYWLFRDMTKAAADTHLETNTEGTPASGIFSFAGSAVNSGAATAPFAKLDVSDNTIGTTFPVVYAADARASLPPPAMSHTVVTWTIAPGDAP